MKNRAVWGKYTNLAILVTDGYPIHPQAAVGNFF